MHWLRAYVIKLPQLFENINYEWWILLFSR